MKKIYIGIATFAIALICMYNVILSPGKMKMSDIALSNIEALARNESGPGNVYDVDCHACKAFPYDYDGIVMFCIPGSGGCYPYGGCGLGTCGY